MLKKHNVNKSLKEIKMNVAKIDGLCRKYKCPESIAENIMVDDYISINVSRLSKEVISYNKKEIIYITDGIISSRIRSLARIITLGIVNKNTRLSTYSDKSIYNAEFIEYVNTAIKNNMDRIEHIIKQPEIEAKLLDDIRIQLAEIFHLRNKYDIQDKNIDIDESTIIEFDIENESICYVTINGNKLVEYDNSKESLLDHKDTWESAKIKFATKNSDVRDPFYCKKLSYKITNRVRKLNEEFSNSSKEKWNLE